MREIKFRAWWKDQRYSPDGGMYGVAGIDWTLPDIGEPERELFAVPQSVALVDYPYEVGTHQKMGWNNDCILMQYTGLKDKNGVEIYEGDMVEYKAYNIWHRDEVKFTDGKFHGNLNGVKEELQSRYDLGLIVTLGCEVIGNIYENPELLNKEAV